jgi:hypothetical protein
MAHQTSKIPQKQSTPRSIGRLMDADFFGVTTLSSSRQRANSCSSLGGVKLPKSEVSRRTIPKARWYRSPSGG